MKFGAKSKLSRVALTIGHSLNSRGIRAVLTGGACAAIHSRGAYTSLDVDFVISGAVDQADLDEVLGGLGFRRDGTQYVHPETPFTVEFPVGPLAIGEDHDIRPIRAAGSSSRALLLSATDSCRDRLAAFYHWGDRQSLTTALAIASRSRVNMSKIRRWSLAEGHGSRFEEFRAGLEQARKERDSKSS